MANIESNVDGLKWSLGGLVFFGIGISQATSGWIGNGFVQRVFYPIGCLLAGAFCLWCGYLMFTADDDPQKTIDGNEQDQLVTTVRPEIQTTHSEIAADGLRQPNSTNTPSSRVSMQLGSLAVAILLVIEHRLEGCSGSREGEP